MAPDTKRRKVTAASLRERKGREPIVALTAYDFPTAVYLDSAGVDLLLVGDTLGCVVAGQPNTLGVTLEQTILHTRYVAAGVKHALVVADLPFLSYEISPAQAQESAGRCVKEAGAEAVKLEGGVRMQEQIEAILRTGVPVVAHVGLTPQAVHRFGGMRVQGRDEVTRAAILRDAMAVAEAGAFCVVVEGVPRSLGKEITAQVPIPTIGIGAGPDCDGQILVTHDMVGLHRGHTPSFVKRYRELGRELQQAAEEFAREVRQGQFPGEEFGYDG
jgi:3-methyl-2-oxobutanoate hydroxymethyltransferase